jgi:hypothetical protein
MPTISRWLAKLTSAIRCRSCARRARLFPGHDDWQILMRLNANGFYANPIMGIRMPNFAMRRYP